MLCYAINNYIIYRIQYVLQIFQVQFDHQRRRAQTLQGRAVVRVWQFSAEIKEMLLK